MKKDQTALSKRVGDLYDSPTLPAETDMLVDIVVEGLESGSIKVVDRDDAPGSSWRVNDWVKKAILLHLRLHGDHHDEHRSGVHIAPNAVIKPGCIVHIGAYLDEGCTINSGVVVGACARIGKFVRIGSSSAISDGLTPPERMPVVIEDNVYIGANCSIGGGWLIESNAVIAPGTSILAGMPIIDAATGNEHRNKIPANAVVVPGGRLAKSGDTQFYLEAPIIIGRVEASQTPQQALEQAVSSFLGN